jgi:vacuolar-type H+-ATPase subunit I/STV1
MVPPDVSAEVLRFIEERIDSVPQLETLLMMNDERARAWTVADVAARAYVSLDEAARILDALRRHALIVPDMPGPAFRVELAHGRERELVGEVARAYRANLTRIATFIHDKPPASLKEFARAFDLKKER